MVEHRRLAGLVAAVALTLAACGGGDASTVSPTAGSPTQGPGSLADPSSVSGDPVPTLEVEAFDGSTVSLADYAGTPMVVNFWASWCPPCIAEMPDLESVHQAAGDRLAFVGVNTQDTREDAAEMVEETGVTYDLVRDPDGALGQAFGVFGMPSTFYVDPDGTIVGRHTGLLTRDALLEDLREHLDIDVQPAG